MISLKESLIRKNRTVDVDAIRKQEIVNFLKENYAKLGPQGISKYIDKTAVQCRSMAQRLGLYNTTKQKK